jgi:acyl-CoA hydrolase
VRIISEARLSALLGARPDAPRVVAGGNFATPWRALAVLDAAVAEYRLFMLNAQAGVPDRDGVILESPFVGPGMRGRRGLRYFPCRLSLVPVLLADTLPPDIAVIQTSAPSGGTVSLGTEVNVLPAAIEAVRARDEFAIIGDRVAALVSDGATLQLGIGAVPDAVLAALTARRGLRVWSEMFSDGVLALDKAGALDPDHQITASFAFGSAELYDWMSGNADIRMLRTETTNDPALIARRPRMMSINSALQVDLFAQANASRVRGVIYSGFGGQTDFVVGALHSSGGRAIIALPSWQAKADVSTVVPRLAGPVTSFQHSFFVSDQGTAAIWGHDASAQAEQIISLVAHPSARAELREAGRELGFGV